MFGRKKKKEDDSGAPCAKAQGARRRPGRPAASEKGGVSRQSILQKALTLSKTVALQDLSIVAVARSIDVTPALIHYYIGGRDWLTSGIMNLFYEGLLQRLPDSGGDWKEDVWNSAKAFFDHLLTYSGVAAYLVTNERFRVFQLTDFDDPDYGVEVLNRFVGQVRSAGLSGARTGLYTLLINEFVISTAHRATHKLLPADHRQFHEGKLASLDPVRMDNLLFGKVAPLELNAERLFKEGMAVFL
ncbi:MAG: hypothetical protein EOP84_08760, partial [Verrucomicrobiaceae bacterium]